MTPRRIFAAVFTICLLLSAVPVFAGKNPDKPKKLTDAGRKSLIRNLTAEMVFVRKFFPMGKHGLKIENGVVAPSDAEIRQMITDNGPAAKPGDRVKITNVKLENKAIVLEINGGPVKKKPWYERLQVGGNGGAIAPAAKDQNVDDLYVNARGSYVVLSFKDYVPEISSDQVKQMLDPVFDWKANSVAEAFTKALSPALQAALKDHKALVGMDRELVTYAKGRPPRKHRERDVANNKDYEEWIYGEPPSEVEFIRFVGDRVVRIETMKVDGEKIVRTKPEIDLESQLSTMAKRVDEEKPEVQQKGPTLLRDGEQPAKPNPSAPIRQPKPNTGEPPRPGGPPLGVPSTIPDASSGPGVPEPGPPR